MACDMYDKLMDSYPSENRDSSLGGSGSHPIDTPFRVGQAFRTGSEDKTLSCAEFLTKMIECGGSVNATIEARLYACTGTPGIDGQVEGEALAISINNYHITSVDADFILRKFKFDGYLLKANTNYCITTSTYMTDTEAQIGTDESSPTHDGNTFYGNFTLSTKDTIFYIYEDKSWSPQLAMIIG